MKDFLYKIINEAGQIALDQARRLDSIEVTHKSRRDIVTQADIAVEDYLVAQIKKRYPSHAILGEESGSHSGSEYRWIIDPIDGTLSYFRNHRYYSISIAVEKEGQTVLGAVFAPALDELFIAEKGRGAFLNGKPVSVSTETELADCILATGFACLRDNVYDNTPYFAEIIPKITDIRRCGSAALDMCYTACGRFDGFWELNLNIYDLAAGKLIAEEAGARVSDFSGEPVSDYKEIVCTNSLIHGKLVDILKRVKNA